MKLGDKRCTGPDHDSAHQKRAQDSPEQDAMLVFGGNAEIGEDQRDHENVVHREGEFDDVAGKKFESVIGALKRNEQAGKTQRKKRENGGPTKGLLELHYRRPSMEYSEIQSQKDQYANEKSGPMP